MKKGIVLMLMLTATITGFAQDKEPVKEGGFDKSKLFFGGNFGLSFGSGYNFVNVSPQLGYRFNRYLAAGVGVNFSYSSLKSFYNNGDVFSRQTQGVTGLNIFGRVYPIEQLLLQVQPELNYTWGKYKEYNPDVTYKLESKFVPSLLIGAGGAIPAGRGSFIVLAQYDVIQDVRSPYGNKVFFSFGYNIGF
jgi:hypothetical protein